MAEKTPNQQLAESCCLSPLTSATSPPPSSRRPTHSLRATRNSSTQARPSARWPLRASRCSRTQATSSSTRRRPTPPAIRSISASWARPSWLPPSAPAASRTASIWSSLTLTAPSGPAPDPAVRVRPLQLLQDPLLRRHPQVSVGHHAAGHPRRVHPCRRLQRFGVRG